MQRGTVGRSELKPLATSMVSKANQQKQVSTAREFMQKIINWDVAQQWAIDTSASPGPGSIEIRGVPDTDASRDLVYVLISIAALVIIALITVLLATSRALPFPR